MWGGMLSTRKRREHGALCMLTRYRVKACHPPDSLIVLVHDRFDIDDAEHDFVV